MLGDRVSNKPFGTGEIFTDFVLGLWGQEGRRERGLKQEHFFQMRLWAQGPQQRLCNQHLGGEGMVALALIYFLP